MSRLLHSALLLAVLLAACAPQMTDRGPQTVDGGTPTADYPTPTPTLTPTPTPTPTSLVVADFLMRQLFRRR